MLKRVLIVAALVLAAGKAQAQTAPEVLARLQSGNAPDRMTAFYGLLYPDGARLDLRPATAALVERARAQAALTPALVALTAREQAYMKASRRPPLSEEYANYYGDVICVVAALRDKRALPVLIRALDTGGLASEGVAALGDDAVMPLVAALRPGEPTGDRRRAVGAAMVRMGAAGTLGLMLQRADRPLAPANVAAARQGLLLALTDPETVVRTTTVRALDRFTDAEVRQAVLKLQATDTARFTQGGRTTYPVREAAGTWLKTHPAQ